MNIVAIDKELHKNWKIKSNNLSNTANLHLCPALAQEYMLLAPEFPIIFAKDQATGAMRSLVMLGLKPEQNLFYRDGNWLGRYIPSTLRAYPFVITPIPNSEGRGAVCIDTDSDLVVQDADSEGQSLFDEQGNQTDFLKSINNYLAAVMAQTEFTDNMLRFLEKKQLLEQSAMTVKLKDGSNHRLTQIYRVNEAKFNDMSDADFIETRKAGYLPAIYAHLLSLGQVDNLARLYPTANQAKRDIH